MVLLFWVFFFFFFFRLLWSTNDSGLDIIYWREKKKRLVARIKSNPLAWISLPLSSSQWKFHFVKHVRGFFLPGLYYSCLYINRVPVFLFFSNYSPYLSLFIPNGFWEKILKYASYKMCLFIFRHNLSVVRFSIFPWIKIWLVK